LTARTSVVHILHHHQTTLRGVHPLPQKHQKRALKKGKQLKVHGTKGILDGFSSNVRIHSVIGHLLYLLLLCWCFFEKSTHRDPKLRVRSQHPYARSPRSTGREYDSREQPNAYRALSTTGNGQSLFFTRSAMRTDKYAGGLATLTRKIVYVVHHCSTCRKGCSPALPPPPPLPCRCLGELQH